MLTVVTNGSHHLSSAYPWLGVFLGTVHVILSLNVHNILLRKWSSGFCDQGYIQRWGDRSCHFFFFSHLKDCCFLSSLLKTVLREIFLKVNCKGKWTVEPSKTHYEEITLWHNIAYNFSLTFLSISSYNLSSCLSSLTNLWYYLHWTLNMFIVISSLTSMLIKPIYYTVYFVI